MFLSPFSRSMSKVDPYNCWDGVGNGATGDEEFDNLLSILDFPMESLETDGLAGDWDVSQSQCLGPIPSDMLIGPPMISQSKAEIGPPVFLHKQDAPELKPVPYQFEETYGSCIRRQHISTEVQEQGVFQSQSPVSVLENGASSLPGKSLLIKSQTSKRTRSKRARPSGANPWLLISPLLSTSSASRSRKNRESRKKLSNLEIANETFGDSSDGDEILFPASNCPAPQRSSVTKKCAHCEVTKTPQWREGPMGPKTLCNACGVRYRSGRLYPEYRPAASPTFAASVHSNSHKKVIEMRNKAKQQQGIKTEGSPMSYKMEFIPVSGFL